MSWGYTNKDKGTLVIPVGGEISIRCEMTEWDFFAPQITCEQPGGTKYADKPMITLEFLLVRKFSWFVFNQMIMMFLIASLAFVAFGVPVSDLADRCSITLALLLTIVAQKLSLVDSLPKLSYLTFLDRYIIHCLGVVIIVTIESFIASYICLHQIKAGGSNEEAIKSNIFEKERYVIYPCFGLWLLYNMLVVCRVWRRTSAIKAKFGTPWK